MKSKLFGFLTLLISTLFFSCSDQIGIGKFYILFNTSTNLTSTGAQRLPQNSEKIRKVKTDKGEVDVTRIDGYRVIYNNDKNIPFVNLKVELSEKNSYNNDKRNLIENLKYLNSNSTDMETEDLIELEVNGYKLYGVSRKTTESGSTLGTFMMFPGNGVTVYLYFMNSNPEFRNFNSIENYKIQRDNFIDEYTKYLIAFKDK